jgi:hypothetical protein
MNPKTERAQPTSAQRPTFYWADYRFAPVYGWHCLKTTQNADPVLPEQILLHEPLQQDPFGKVQAAAQARNGHRSCLWWVEWQPTPLDSVFCADNKTVEGLQLLVFHQPKSGDREPFRLLILPADHLPKVSQKRWQWILDILISLPAMDGPEPIHDTTDIN